MISGWSLLLGNMLRCSGWSDVLALAATESASPRDHADWILDQNLLARQARALPRGNSWSTGTAFRGLIEP